MLDTMIDQVLMSEIHFDEDFNCRGKIAPIDVVDLAKDIAQKGLIQPVVVYNYKEEEIAKFEKRYHLLVGFRRYTAFKVLKKDKIPCVIQPWMPESEARAFNLAENIQRKDLNIVEEARAIAKLRDIGIGEPKTAEMIGKSRGWVQVRFMVLSLPEDVQTEIAAGLIPQKQIRDLYSILGSMGEEKCFEAARNIKDAKIKGQKAISVQPQTKRIPAKKHRDRASIFRAMEHIQDSIGNCFGTRCLAWTAGEITNSELFDSVEDAAKTMGIDYDKPEDF